MKVDKNNMLIVEKTNFEGFASFEKAILELSDGTREELNADTLFYEDNTLFCRVKEGSMTASFTPFSSLFIADRLIETGGAYYMTVCGRNIFLKNINTETNSDELREISP